MTWPVRVFLAGRSLSLLGDGLTLLAVPLLVLELTRDPLVSALSAAPVTIGYLLVGLPAGVLVDRLNPWRVLAATDALRAVLFGLLYLLYAVGRPSVFAIIAIAVLAGACHVFFETALVVAVKDVVAPTALVRANSAIELASQLSRVLGPAAVGLLAGISGIQTALLVNSLTFLLSLLSLTAIRTRVHGPPTRTRLTARRFGRDFVAGLKYLRTVPLLIVLTTVQIVVNLCLAVEKLLYFFTAETLRFSPFQVAVVVAAGGVGGILGALCASRLVRALGPKRLIIAAVGVAGCAIAALGVVNAVWAVSAVHVIYIAGVVVASLTIRTLRQQIVPRELLGRVTGVVRMLFLAVDPIGVVVAGLIVTAIGGDPRPVFVGAGTVIIATVLLSRRRIERAELACPP